MRSFLNPGWRGDLLAAAAGCLITLSLAPFDFWPAGLLALALLHVLIDPLPPRAAFARGWWFGVGMHLSGVSWVYVSIHDYGYAPVPLALALTLGYCLGLALVIAIFTGLYARWLRAWPSGNWLGFAALWVLMEWFRSWFLTGFPWLYIGYAHLDSPLTGWAPVAGVYGIGLALALTAAALAMLVSAQPQRAFAPLLLCAALWFAGWLLNDVKWVEPAGEPIPVALVQANIPQQLKWDRAYYEQTLDSYRELSAPLWPEARIVVWPEAAIPAFYQDAAAFLDSQAALARARGSTLITGVPYRAEPTPEFPRGPVHNSIVALGEGSGLYHKVRLVPFGEYVPLQHWLRGLIRFFDLPMSDFAAGPKEQAPLQAAGVALAPFICYEVVYPELVANWLPQADALITISNDAWFGRSIGPLQHLQMAQMRALESGRYMLRGTGNGVTAIIDERGRITAQLPQFERGVLRGEFMPMRGATPFARTDTWAVIGLCFALLAGCGLAEWLRRR